MDMLISLIVVSISQCVHIRKHRIVDLKYMQFLIVNYTSVKLRGGEYFFFVIFHRPFVFHM